MLPYQTRTTRSAGSFLGRTCALSFVLAVIWGTGLAAQQDPITPFATDASTPCTAPVTVTLVDGDEVRAVQTSAQTMGEMLAQEKAHPGREDRCSVPLATVPRDGLRVTVTRVQSKTLVERFPIPFTTKQQFTSSLRAGIRQVKQAGKKGERVKTFLEVYKNGQQSQRKKIAERVTPPRQAVVLAGTRGMLASRGHFAGRRVLDMIATGYGPGARCNGRWANRTASGMRPGYGVVAVDPRLIRLGTRLYIEGYGNAIAGDTGGAIKGARIDLGYNTYREAVRVGRKRVKVLILN